MTSVSACRTTQYLTSIKIRLGSPKILLKEEARSPILFAGKGKTDDISAFVCYSVDSFDHLDPNKVACPNFHDPLAHSTGDQEYLEYRLGDDICSVKSYDDDR